MRALGFGVFVAALLVTAYTFADAKLTELADGPGVTRLIPPLAAAQAAALYSIFVASFIALLCAPLWLAMARWKLTGWFSAAALGFAATITLWLSSNLGGGASVQDLASAWVWAAFGAIAGVSTWWASPQRRHG